MSTSALVEYKCHVGKYSYSYRKKLARMLQKGYHFSKYLNSFPHTTPGEHKSQSLKRGEISFLQQKSFQLSTLSFFDLKTQRMRDLGKTSLFLGLSDSGYSKEVAIKGFP